MKKFWLERLEDLHGNSGVGIVAEGIIFSDGTCAMHWISDISSTTLFPDIATVGRLHGHNGRTKLLYNLPILQEGRLAA